MSLIADALGCERNGRVVFSDVSFTLAPAQCAELRGANGAGKSSLLRVVAGLVPLASGALTLDGESELAMLCHYAGHLDGIKSAMTVSENLQFWADCFGGGDVDAALASFALRDLRDESVQILSAGQRRRLALSRMLLSHRKLWLLDEPMTALDAASQEKLCGHMKTHLANGGMIMVATHGDLGFVPHHVIAL
jgi:heme exporter protein A